MRRSVSVGSMWTSEARSFRAWRMRRFTYRTMGAASVIVWMSSTPLSGWVLSMPSDASMAMSLASPLLKARLMYALICDRVATTTMKFVPMIVRRSSMANTSVGFEVATTGTPLSLAMSMTLWWGAVDVGG